MEHENYPDFYLHCFLGIKQSIIKLGRQHPKVAKLFEEKKVVEKGKNHDGRQTNKVSNRAGRKVRTPKDKIFTE